MRIDTMSIISTRILFRGMGRSLTRMSMGMNGCVTVMPIFRIFIIDTGTITAETGWGSHEAERFQGADFRLLRDAHRLGKRYLYCAPAAAEEGWRHPEAG